ncbi:sensor histidine kinase [Arcticibacter tournemirensis]
MKKPIVQQIAFWCLGILVLTLIYGTAYDDYRLGFAVILMLLPVHMVYFYAVSYWIIPRFFFRQKYIVTVIACLTVAILVAVLYRLNEILISDPYIFQFYKARDPAFSWSKLDGTFIQQLLRPGDFVNAVERSNVIVWIGISLRFIQMWYERQQAAVQAELNFLKGQVHPHFLFNTLNNLYALSLSESKQTPGVILGLSNILRYMLYECRSDEVLLKRDIEILQSYVALEKIRYEERLDLNFTLHGDPGARRIAPLLMLPLVENAFKHGVSETVDAPWISIELMVQNDQLLLKVANSKPEGRGPAGKRDFEKVGLSNVRKRLELLYPGRYTLELDDEDDVYIAVLKIHTIQPALINGK